MCRVLTSRAFVPMPHHAAGEEHPDRVAFALASIAPRLTLSETNETSPRGRRENSRIKKTPLTFSIRAVRRASQFERNTASAAPMGPAANTTQAFEANAGLMTIEALKALGAEKKRERRARGESNGGE